MPHCRLLTDSPLLATASASLGAALNAADLLVVGIGLTVMLAIGAWAGRRERDTRDFFLGGRGVPGWAAALSFVAAEVSAATILTVPAEAFRSNWQYLQMFVGSAAARVVVAAVFIPVFFRHDCTTIYEYLRTRFGPATHYTASIFFFITRLLASAVRLFLAAMGLATIAGWTADGEGRAGIAVAIVLLSVIGMAFIAYGGIKAVIWTSVVQAGVILAGGAALAAFLVSQLDGDTSQWWHTAAQAGRLKLLNLTLNPADAQSLPLMAMNGFLVSLVVFGTDQDLMQRLLCVQTRGRSQRSLIATIGIALPVSVLFLSIGTLLFLFARQHPGWTPPPDADRILPAFTVAFVPHLLKGLILLMILMASIDSPLGSLAASFVTDIYRPLIRRDADERHYLRVSRISVVLFGLLLGGLALGVIRFEQRLWLSFQVLGVTGGGLLGVFLLGMLTRRGRDATCAATMIISAVTMLVLYVLIQKEVVSLGWTWLILIGTSLTFGLGALARPNPPTPG